MAKVDLKELAELRALGVKSIEIHTDGAHFVEFFPVSLLEQADALTAETEAPEDRPTEPPKPEERVPTAFRNILTKGSVS